MSKVKEKLEQIENNKLQKTYCCPKCKHTGLILTEVWKDSYMNFTYDNGTVEKIPLSENYGDPYKVTAFCRECNHEWTLRGVYGIDQVGVMIDYRS